MGVWELFVLAVGLSMDAFAVSICKGTAMKRVGPAALIAVGLWFGGFQAGMPLLGYYLGALSRTFITSVDHWVAFFLLTLIGFNLIQESLSKKDRLESADGSLGFRIMFLMAVATSIDALAVGVTFAFLDVSLPPAVTMIGGMTFLLSALGLLIGRGFGQRYKKKAQGAGGRF